MSRNLQIFVSELVCLSVTFIQLLSLLSDFHTIIQLSLGPDICKNINIFIIRSCHPKNSLQILFLKKAVPQNGCSAPLMEVKEFTFSKATGQGLKLELLHSCFSIISITGADMITCGI